MGIRRFMRGVWTRVTAFNSPNMATILAGLSLSRRAFYLIGQPKVGSTIGTVIGAYRSSSQAYAALKKVIGDTQKLYILWYDTAAAAWNFIKRTGANGVPWYEDPD